MNKQLRWRKPLSYVASFMGALLAVIIVSWAVFIDHDLHDLRWKLRSGEVLRYRSVMRMTSQGSETCTIMLLRFTVGNVSAEGIADVTSLLEQATMRKGGPEGPVTWDSASGGPVPKDYTIAMTAAMIGVPIRYKVDARGVILSTEGTDLVQKRARQNLGGDMFGAFTAIPFSEIGANLMGSPLPGGRVKRGARWNHEGVTGTQEWGKSRFVSEYTLRSVRQGLATITQLESRTTEETPGDIPKAMNIKIPPDPTAKHGNEDTTEFSIAEGVVVSQRTRGWTQSTVSKGTLFRFECSAETTLIERRAP